MCLGAGRGVGYTRRMNTTVLIPLERGWLCEIAANPPVISLVNQLSRWQPEPNRGAATLTLGFALEPTDFCVGYELIIDHAPDGTRVTVNGSDVGTAGHDGLRVDVTDHVALEDNSIRLSVAPGAIGMFAGVRIQGTPCE